MKHHTQSRDDGLSLRIDYGNTSVLVLGGVTAAGEREIVSSGAYVQADALICSGEENTAGAEIVAAVQPKIALVTSKQAANSVRIRLERAGAEVCAMKENGVMTLYSDGQTMTVER